MKAYFDKLYKDGQQDFFIRLNSALEKEEKMFVVTANPETLMIGKKKSEFNKLLLDPSTVIVPDGIGTVKAAKYLGYPVKERITGVDIAKHLLETANVQKKSIFLFGANEYVVSALSENIKRDYPNISILGYENGYVNNKDEVMEKISLLSPDIVLVALGIPQQELLIYKHLSKFNKGIFVGVGGSFDVLSGMKKRAPKVFIRLNLEWLYRITKEPKRLRRFFESNVKFMLAICKMK